MSPTILLEMTCVSSLDWPHSKLYRDAVPVVLQDRGTCDHGPSSVPGAISILEQSSANITFVVDEWNSAYIRAKNKVAALSVDAEHEV